MTQSWVYNFPKIANLFRYSARSHMRSLTDFNLSNGTGAKP